MSLADRIGRSLFVALAVGLAWGIRGDFGHLVGAMYPGRRWPWRWLMSAGSGRCFSGCRCSPPCRRWRSARAG